MPPSDHWE